jgi:glycosyltransferase involved in cell wall biosynthesis
LKRSADFDAVFLHKKRLNLIEALLLRRYSRKTIYDFDDAVMYKTVAPQRKTLCGSMRFRLTVKLADLVIAGNPYLAEHAHKFNTKVEVLPTGLNTNEYEITATRKTDGKVRLVWIGSRSTLRYLAEIAPALEEIGSRHENVILRIVCGDFIDLEKMSVEKCLWSEQTQIADLVTSDIGLAPLPDNRFTRGKCGFKILQYASAGLPVVASPVGVNRDYVRDNITGYLASDTEQWVDRISRLVENAQLRKNMGQSARKSVKRFDISVIGEQLAALILQCAGHVIS